jgi:PadR family transcriptional regulator, regulatory protein PadR
MRKREYLGQFELMVLLAILRVGDDAYGVPLANEIEASTSKTVSLGSIYAALERLEEKGLVSSVMGEPTPERGGRARRYFRVTSAGLRALRDMHRMLVSLWANLPQLKGGTA